MSTDMKTNQESIDVNANRESMDANANRESMDANATGCSSIWGGSAPSTPYTTNKDGKGPAWANSLFEDNAEYGYGMYIAQNTIRQRTIEKLGELEKTTKSNDLKAAIAKFIATKDNGKENTPATN